MDAVGQHLERLVRDCNSSRRLREDPVEFIHRYRHPLDQEVVGFVAASLAFGNAAAARRSIERVLSALGKRWDPYAFVDLCAAAAARHGAGSTELLEAVQTAELELLAELAAERARH